MADELDIGRRIHVVGCSGSGKTTVAGRLAEALGLVHIELDALHWQPGWTERDRDDFRSRLRALLQSPGWVVDGNYGNRGRDLIWAAADTIVWLDLPKHEVMRQVIRRTVRRWWRDEELWNGNKERLGVVLCSRDSIVWWAWSSHGRRHREYTELFAGGGVRQTIVRLRSRAEVDAWLAEVGASRI